MSEVECLEDYESARRMHGALWAAGDYTRVAEQLTGVSAAVVEAAGTSVLTRVRTLDQPPWAWLVSVTPECAQGRVNPTGFVSPGAPPGP
jgi:hypothetical protein